MDIPYVTAGVNQLFEMPEVTAALNIFKFLDDDNVLLSVIGQGAARATVADFAHLQPVA